MFRSVIKTLKVKHYIKNIIVFVPIIFSMNFTSIEAWIKTFMIFLAFCCISSTVYIMNDLIDIKKDKLHPIKSKRPIASGKITKKMALIILAFLLCFACYFAFELNYLSLLMVLSYFILNIFYSVSLKNIGIIDVFCIAFGFILRVLGGCFAINVIPSPLVILLTFFTSMFFTFSKRKLEYQIIEDESKYRVSIKEYTESLLNQYVSINAILSIAFYFTYMLDPSTIQKAGTEYLYLTAIPFTLIIFRLLLKIFTCSNNDDPAEIIYKDKMIIVILILYLGTLITVLLI